MLASVSSAFQIFPEFLKLNLKALRLSDVAVKKRKNEIPQTNPQSPQRR
jgi:hypothetical protein